MEDFGAIPFRQPEPLPDFAPVGGPDFRLFLSESSEVGNETPLEFMVEPWRLLGEQVEMTEISPVMEGVIDELFQAVSGEIAHRGWPPTVGAFRRLLVEMGTHLSNTDLMGPLEQLVALRHVVPLMRLTAKVM